MIEGVAETNKYRSSRRWPLFLLLGLLVGSLALFSLHPSRQIVTAAPPTAPRAVACLGRLIPEGGIVRVAAPYALQSPAVISELRVKEGDRVKQGDIIAITHNHAALAGACRLEEEKLKGAQYRLAKVKAGEKQGDIEAQKAEVQRCVAELANAGKDLERDKKLFTDGTISDSDYRRTQLLAETARQALAHARESLKSVEEVRDVDVQVAQSDVDTAVVSVEKAKAELEQTVIRAPSDGQVLRVLTRVGEQPGNDGVLEIGRTDKMTVEAEVYETDIGRVKTGQRVEITSESFTGKLDGTVTSLGLRVGKNRLLDTDPSAFADNRVVEVKIRLENSTAVAGLSFAQVNVRILP